MKQKRLKKKPSRHGKTSLFIIRGNIQETGGGVEIKMGWRKL